VLRLLSDDADEAGGGGTPHALVYTHPGCPAYCGMNSEGLCVLNLYIDDDSGDGGDGVGAAVTPAGVPIDAAIRELLAHRTLESAIAWIERGAADGGGGGGGGARRQQLPRTAPTTFVLVQGEEVACVEATAERTATLRLRGTGAEFVHSNHALLDQRLLAAGGGAQQGEGAEAGDGGGASSPGELGSGGAQCVCSSGARLEAMRRSVRRARWSEGGVSVEDARQLLLACPPADPDIAPTLASVVMEPARRRMHVKFAGEVEWLAVDVCA
jgi:hypothetical protein